MMISLEMETTTYSDGHFRGTLYLRNDASSGISAGWELNVSVPSPHRWEIAAQSDLENPAFTLSRDTQTGDDMITGSMPILASATIEIRFMGTIRTGETLPLNQFAIPDPDAATLNSVAISTIARLIQATRPPFYADPFGEQASGGRIQSAIDTAAYNLDQGNNGPTEVSLPGGIYLSRRTLGIPRDVSLIGDDQDQTVLDLGSFTGVPGLWTESITGPETGVVQNFWRKDDQNPTAVPWGGPTDSYKGLVLERGPAAAWWLEELSGNFADSSGNGRTLTANGSVGRGATPLLPSFSAASEFRVSANAAIASPGFNWATPQQTFECWVQNRDTQSTATWTVFSCSLLSLIIYANSSGSSSSSARLDFAVSASGSGAGTVYTYQPTGGWVTYSGGTSPIYHVVVTYDGAKARIYRNGSLLYTTPTHAGALAFPGSDQQFRIGGSSTRGGAPRMNAVAHYPFALSSTEVAQNYQMGQQ